MEMIDRDALLVSLLCQGLPLVERPYHSLGLALGMDEDEVLDRLKVLVDQGTIRRLGVIVRHHELGYRANAMVVWDIPDAEVTAAGDRLSARPEVTLCYRRPRRLPDWPYNLFTMIHGRARDDVERKVAALAEDLDLDAHPRAVLFSLRRFKQCGARYAPRAEAAE